MQYNRTNTTMVLAKVERNLTMTPYQKIISYIDNIISDKAERLEDGYFLTVDDLDTDEQGELAALFLDYYDRDTSECFYEADQYAINDNITCALLKMLQNDTPDNREDFANLVRNNTIKRFRKNMEEMIDERCSALFADEMSEAGLHAHYHADNGERYWSRHV